MTPSFGELKRSVKVSTNTEAHQRDKAAEYGEISFELIVSEVFTSSKPMTFSYKL